MHALVPLLAALLFNNFLPVSANRTASTLLRLPSGAPIPQIRSSTFSPAFTHKRKLAPANPPLDAVMSDLNTDIQPRLKNLPTTSGSIEKRGLTELVNYLCCKNGIPCCPGLPNAESGEEVARTNHSVPDFPGFPDFYNEFDDDENENEAPSIPGASETSSGTSSEASSTATSSVDDFNIEQWRTLNYPPSEDPEPLPVTLSRVSAALRQPNEDLDPITEESSLLDSSRHGTDPSSVLSTAVQESEVAGNGNPGPVTSGASQNSSQSEMELAALTLANEEAAEEIAANIAESIDSTPPLVPPVIAR